MKPISNSRLREVLNYDLETGIFTWKIRLSARSNMSLPAGTINDRGYRMIRIDHQIYSAHRLAWQYITGEVPENSIDHIDGNTDNNAFKNLRDVAQSINTKNNKISKNNTSGYPGVYFNKSASTWYVQIWLNKKCISVGTRKTKDSAILLRKEREIYLGYETRLGN